ncbi:MAG TPA: hypothetical protein VFU08_04440 [Candidatus Udaeobacter sp.]|nr:hypothetical protein [Candidatus Udaeobacter sp.]
MKKHWLSLAIASFGLTLIFNPVAASADPEVFEASGATPADIQTAVDAFRNFLGPNNGPVPSETFHARARVAAVVEAVDAMLTL